VLLSFYYRCPDQDDDGGAGTNFLIKQKVYFQDVVMKIMIIGVFNETSTNNGIVNGFKNNGHEAIRYAYREREKVLGGVKRDEEIVSFCEYKKPDLVFFCKCNKVHINVIHDCNRVSKTFLWYMDPLNGNYDEELRLKIKHCNMVGIAKYEVYLLAKKINPNTHFLIEGFDPAWDFPIEESLPLYNVSFIGRLRDSRKSLIEELGGVNHFENKYNIDHSKIVGASKINLNFTNQAGPSDRIYKILAAKGFLLSETYLYIERYGLVPGRDLVLFNSIQELKAKIKYYLEHEKERLKIAEHGYNTVQKFSRDNLAKQVVECIKF
jgi:hypothetical protein